MKLVFLLLVNLILSIIFYFKNKNNGQIKYISLFFIFCPFLGFVVYGIGLWVLKQDKTYHYDADTLKKRIQFEKSNDELNVENELNVIPISDVMLMGKNEEKRKLILEQLKKGILENYKNVSIASSDSDSESVHYISSAKVEVYKNLKRQVSEATEVYEKNVQDQEALDTLLNKLAVFINSSLLSQTEKNNYLSKYCLLYKLKKAFIDSEQTVQYLEYLHFLKQYEELENYFNSLQKTNKTEDMYRIMLSYFHDIKNKSKFYSTLDEMKHADIVLTSKGLEMIRFWS